jgi:hypothetical protein
VPLRREAMVGCSSLAAVFSGRVEAIVIC